MRLKNLNNIGVELNLWVRVLEDKKLEDGMGHISVGRSGNAYRLNINGQSWNVELRDKSQSYDLDHNIRKGCAHIVEVIQVATDNTADLKIVFFNGDIIEIDDIEVGIDKHIEDTARKKAVNFHGINELGEILSEKCAIQVGDESFFVILAGRSSDNDFEHGKEDGLKRVDEKYRSFSVCGDGLRIPVAEKRLSQLESIFHADRIIFKNQQNLTPGARLARGKISFVSTASRVKAVAKGAMSRIIKNEESYLKKWDEYGAVEGEMLLSRAKDIGRIDWTETSRTNNGVKFFVSSIPSQLSVGDGIEITSEQPLYIRNPDVTWEDYSKEVEKDFFSKEDRNKEKKKCKSKGREDIDVDNDDNQKENDFRDSLHVSVLDINLVSNSIELDVPGVPDKGSFLILSTKGEETQIGRRMRARTSILEGSCANPQLGLLIEEGGVIPEVQRVTKLKALTPFVKNKIFKHEPTDKQKEAIEVALNTPDMALIQGPPGTGKTTVVTAIIERLNEEFDKTQSIRGQILVSGFQHDAVENIVSRLSINSLPAVKYGGKSTDSVFSEDAVTKKINKWCSDVAEKIREKNPKISQTEEQIRIKKSFHIYTDRPSKKNTLNLMHEILNLPRSIIPESVSIEAEAIIELVEKEEKVHIPVILKFIYALRVKQIAFEDDGVERATDLLYAIEDDPKGVDVDLGILKKAVRWNGEELSDILSGLQMLKNKLLSVYKKPPHFSVDIKNYDVVKLIAQVHSLLNSALDSDNKKNIVLAEFLHELENNPDGIRESVEDYNFVYAATTQQSEGKAIINAKKRFERDNDNPIKYDTVIIDEAARTSPRDLLIPMSRAEKRIILVGDHRQLPHIIDEEIVKSLEGQGASEVDLNEDLLEKSMFEYLFNRLKNLQKQDGTTRTVTLDAQYRTHPLLGKFVSDNFYKEYGESYKSPLPEKYFQQGLQDISGKACAWIDVPNGRGDESKVGYSKNRQAEADVIAQYIHNWIDSEEGYGLSFGVISFYKPQIKAIYKALGKHSITKKMQDGTWGVSQKYKFLENGEERLRIGTVDSFQGMEFDISLLSVVRSQNPEKLKNWMDNQEDHEKIKRGVFGHLMSENRLCVSMSRQKKALVVIGDASLMSSSLATDAVPALKNFYDLCHKEGVIYGQQIRK